MKSRKKIMKLCFFLLNLLMILMFSNSVYADYVPGMSGVTSLAGGQAQAGGLANGINRIIGIIQVAGSGAALITVTMLGIKYLAAGPNEKVDAKKQMLPLLIGSILLFSTVNVVKIISKLANQLP